MKGVMVFFFKRRVVFFAVLLELKTPIQLLLHVLHDADPVLEGLVQPRCEILRKRNKCRFINLVQALEDLDLGRGARVMGIAAAGPHDRDHFRRMPQQQKED